jgi:hypothetical protein
MSSEKDAPVIDPIEGNMGSETSVSYDSEGESALSFLDLETWSFPVREESCLTWHELR